MGKNQLTRPPLLTLVAEEGASLSSGSLRLYAMEGDVAVGVLDLYAYDPLNRRCGVGIVVVTEHRRRGCALAMLQALETLYKGSIHQLYADIAATNRVSVDLFSKAGYTECGHFKEWLAHDGNFIDSIRMQKII